MVRSYLNKVFWSNLGVGAGFTSSTFYSMPAVRNLSPPAPWTKIRFLRWLLFKILVCHRFLMQAKSMIAGGIDALKLCALGARAKIPFFCFTLYDKCFNQRKGNYSLIQIGTPNVRNPQPADIFHIVPAVESDPRPGYHDHHRPKPGPGTPGRRPVGDGLFGGQKCLNPVVNHHDRCIPSFR